MFVGELGCPTLPLLPKPTSSPHIMSVSTTNVAQDLICATPSIISTTCHIVSPTPSAFLLCTQAVSLPDNLTPYIDGTPLIPPDILFTSSFEDNLVPTFYAARLNDDLITQAVQQKKIQMKNNVILVPIYAPQLTSPSYLTLLHFSHH